MSSVREEKWYKAQLDRRAAMTPEQLAAERRANYGGPTTGRALYRWAVERSQVAVVVEVGRKLGFTGRIIDWSRDAAMQIVFAIEDANEAAKAAAPPKVKSPELLAAIEAAEAADARASAGRARVDELRANLASNPGIGLEDDLEAAAIELGVAVRAAALAACEANEIAFRQG